MKVAVFLLLVAMTTAHAKPRTKAVTLAQRRRALVQHLENKPRVQHLVNKHLASAKKRFIPSPVAEQKAFVQSLAKKHALAEKKTSIRSLEKMHQRTERRTLLEKIRALLNDSANGSAVGPECDLTTSFKCVQYGTEQCHPNSWKCDALPDCDDSSDEENCVTECNLTTSYTCLQYGKEQCHQNAWKCDQYADCDDSSDEENCNGSSSGSGSGSGSGGMFSDMFQVCDLETSFKCEMYGIEQCHPKVYRCDGEIDCLDNSDEANCEDYDCGAERVNCQPTWFNSTMCLHPSLKCNGLEDCVDGTDEDGCPGSEDDDQSMPTDEQTNKQTDEQTVPTKRLVDLLKALLSDE